MLVVSRKPGERLLIGESVEVTILSVRGDQVSLGVSAPREVAIHRQELLERIRRENQRAAGLRAEDLKQMRASLRAALTPEEGMPSTPSPPERDSRVPPHPVETKGAA
jgi:carbon storage regulator